MKHPLRLLAALLLAAPAVLATAPRAYAGDEPSPTLAARAFGVSWEETSPSTPAHKEIARRAGIRLMSLCPNCPPSNLTDGSCYWSRISRVVMLNAAVTGKTEDEIVKTYLSIYGPQVLAVGTENGFAMLSWVVPYATVGLALFGLLVLGVRLKRRQRTHETTLPAAPVADPGARAILRDELDALDV